SQGMEVIHPRNLEEALAAVADGMTPLAGGTDLMVEVNYGQKRPERVVALRRLADIADFSPTRIGAGVRWRRIEKEGPRALAQAARTVGSPQIRNAGTTEIGRASRRERDSQTLG